MTVGAAIHFYPPKPLKSAALLTYETRPDVMQGTCAEHTNSQPNQRKLACKKYYERNKDRLQAKARERAVRAKNQRLLFETPAESAARRLRHREVAAKHRENKRQRQLALVTRNACTKDTSAETGA